MKLSECCGAEATDPLMLDYGICPDCQEHCEFETINEDDENNTQNK